MQECPISCKVGIDLHDELQPYLPFYLGRDRTGEAHLLATKNGKLHDVVINPKTGKEISSTSSWGPQLAFWQRSVLAERKDILPWQVVILIEAGFRVQQTRGAARWNWIATTVDALMLYGKDWFFKLRAFLAENAPSGWTTQGELACFSPLDCDPKTFRRWIDRKLWVQKTQGGHFRIQVCDDFCWWYVKQVAAQRAAELVKKHPPGSTVVELTSEALKRTRGQQIDILARDLEALENRLRFRTKTVGWTLEDIAKDPNRDQLWDLDLEDLSPELLEATASKADMLRLAKCMEELKVKRKAEGKSEFVSKASLAKAMGISKRTFLRRPEYNEFYEKQRSRPYQEMRLTEEEARLRGVLQGKRKKDGAGDDEQEQIKTANELHLEETRIPCAKCGWRVKINQPCPKCSARFA